METLAQADDKQQKSRADIQYKVFDFEVQETKEVEREDGLKIGIIRGFLATYGNIDRVNDIIEKGAFSKSIERHKQSSRPIRMLFQHDRKEVIGGFPIAKVQDIELGLFVEGEVNLDVQRGRETFALAKQRVLTDLSIGFAVVKAEPSKDDPNIRILKEVELFEGSIVDEPANPDAIITQVKNQQQTFSAEQLHGIDTKKDFEKFLRDALHFSRSQAKAMASGFIEAEQREAVADETPTLTDNIVSKSMTAQQFQHIQSIINTL